MRVLYIECIFLLLSLNIQAQELNKDFCLTPSIVYNRINGTEFLMPKVEYYKKYKEFNFSEFKPEHEVLDGDDYFKIGFDKIGNVCEITHQELNLRLTNFTFYVYDFQEFKALTYLTRENSRLMYHPILFIYDKNNSKSYMFNVLPQFVMGGQSYFDKLPPIELAKLSCIAFLDRNFFPTHIVRISKGTIIFCSELKYREHSTELLNERISFLNIPELPNYLSLNESKCFDRLLDLFGKGEAFFFTAHPAINPKFKNVPIWIKDGSHTYK